MATVSDKVFLDPRTLTEVDLPIMVLADDLRSFVGWGIKNHTSGNYNHVMISHKPWLMISQGFGGLNEIKMEAYLTPNQMLKFWRIKDLTQGEKNTIYRNCVKRLSLPWYRKQYDYLGILGQFLHLRFIQNPWTTYCSEQVRLDYISEIPRAAKLVPKEPSPSDLDRIFKAHPEVFECLGYYFAD